MGRPSKRPKVNCLSWVGERDATNSFTIGQSNDTECEFRTPVRMPAEPVIDGALPSNNTFVTLANGAYEFAATSKLMTVTGDNNTGLSIITGGYTGVIITLINTDAEVTYSDFGGLSIDSFNLGGGNFAATLNSVLVLVHNGNHWDEISRSVNG